MAKVLVVDDTPDMARLMFRAVEDQGHAVFMAADGQHALAMAAAERPDVILLDIMMPRMNGIEVLRRLKEDEELEAIPVILVTAMGEDTDVVRGLEAGAHDYVTKPFKREILAARVRSAIRIREHHDRLVRLNQRLQAEIAERMQVEQELVQAQKLESLGHLAAGIAHEINTPAQYVRDNTCFLQDVFSDVEKLLGDLDRLLAAAKHGAITETLIAEVETNVREGEVQYIREEVPKAIRQSLEGIERVATIVRAMKEFSHPGSGEKLKIDLNHAIENTLTVSHNEWKYVAELITDLDRQLPSVLCLPNEINQVILNLVVNAAQAIGDKLGDGSRGKGTITVRTRRNGDSVEVDIEDTGTGIPEEIRSKVFDPFFTTKEIGQGTGQGLTIAQDIVVTKHGGSITLQSEIGRGTVFTIRLPIEGAGKPSNSLL
jgi:signal transduction histidine kinase